MLGLKGLTVGSATKAGPVIYVRGLNRFVTRLGPASNVALRAIAGFQFATLWLAEVARS